MLKTIVNGIAGRLGLRIVNARWGPRGFAASFRDARARGFAPAVIVDVGASTGIWTQECLEVFPDARYLMIDPLPGNEPSLRRLSDADSRLDYWSGALGAADGFLELNVHGDQSSALASDEFRGDRLRVPQKRLDTLLAERGLEGVSLIKADVQGLELEVLKGAEQALRSCEMLLLELSIQRIYDMNPLAHEIIAYLGARGFQILDFATYAQRPLDRALAQVDTLFVPRDSPLASRIGWG